MLWILTTSLVSYSIDAFICISVISNQSAIHVCNREKQLIWTYYSLYNMFTREAQKCFCASLVFLKVLPPFIKGLIKEISVNL